MLKYNKKGEGPTPTGGVGNSSLNKMKDYEQINWLDYTPNLKAAKRAATDIARQLSPKSPLVVSHFFWDETEQKYIAWIAAKIVRTGDIMLLAEGQGKFFTADCKFNTFMPYIQVSLSEVDFGHYHRFQHAFNRDTSACESCPEDVFQREAA